MSRMHWTNVGAGRRSLVSLVLVGMLTLAACGGSASQAPSGGPGESVNPGATGAPGDTQAPGPTEGPGQSIAPGDGSTAFAAATTALDALDSYAFRVEIASTSSASGAPITSRTVMSGVVVNRPEKASSLEQAEVDAAGNVTSGSAIVVIGGDAWIRSLPGDSAWTAIPATQADAFIQAMASFRPEQLFGLYFAGVGGSFAAAGTETKNGVDATHYEGDDGVGAIFGAIAGFQGTWTSDVWIANDGGYLVHSEASAESVAGSAAGSFLSLVDITDANAAGPILPPQ